MRRKIFLSMPHILLLVLTSMLLSAVTVLAATGTTDAPAAPGSTGSYTLEDIYQRLANGTAATQSAFTGPSVAPGSGSMHTLNDIYNRIPHPAPEDIKHGVTLLGVTGGYTGPGWKVHTTTAEGYDLFCVTMLSATDGWAVGFWGRIYHYDGAHWSLHTTTAEGSGLNYVTMLNAMDGWAVGNSGRIYHYDGANWSLHTTTAEGSHLYSVSMLSATDGWAVGDSGRIYYLFE